MTLEKGQRLGPHNEDLCEKQENQHNQQLYYERAEQGGRMFSKLLNSAVLRLAFILVCGLLLSGSSHRQSQMVPEELQSLVGSYCGEWSAYGIDGSGHVIKATSWTDTITLSDPVVEVNRAYAVTEDKMYFEGGHIPPMTVSGIEGFFINENGSLGDHFFAMYGQVYRMNQLNDNTWVYTMPGSPQELVNFGFTDIISAQHVVIKVVSNENGTETHRISRITTVNWRDSNGDEKWIHYNSLEGYHRRLR